MGQKNGAGPLNVFLSRVADIKASRASLWVNTYDFNAKFVPVLSYQAQLLPPHEKLPNAERGALHTDHRAPGNTFRHGDFFALEEFGAPKIRSPIIASAAALFRTATKTVTHWPEWVTQLKLAAHEHLPAQQVCVCRKSYILIFGTPRLMFAISSGPMKVSWVAKG